MLKTGKIVISILIIDLLLSCSNMIHNDVSFAIQPYKVKDSVLNITVKNNTDNNCFFTLDTNRIYGYSFYNYEITNSILITFKVFENGKLIYPKLEGGIYKKEFFDKDEEQWNKREINLANNFLTDFILLKNKILMEKDEIKFLKIPFKLIYPYNYNLTNKYILKKGNKYELQIEYQMKKNITEKVIDKVKLDSIEKLGYLPYYGKIISNKVPIIIEE